MPNIKKAATKFGVTPIMEIVRFLKRTKKHQRIPKITIPRVNICDLNKL